MKMIGRQDLIKLIKEEGKYTSLAEAEKALDVVCDAMKKGIIDHGGVKIYGIGSLKKVTKKGRKIKVPNVGVREAPNRAGVSFRETITLKQELN